MGLQAYVEGLPSGNEEETTQAGKIQVSLKGCFSFKPKRIAEIVPYRVRSPRFGEEA